LFHEAENNCTDGYWLNSFWHSSTKLCHILLYDSSDFAHVRRGAVYTRGLDRRTELWNVVQVDSAVWYGVQHSSLPSRSGAIIGEAEVSGVVNALPLWRINPGRRISKSLPAALLLRNFWFFIRSISSFAWLQPL